MTASSKEPLPRFTKLDAFNPHRASFECKHEGSVNPAISIEAEAQFQQAQALTSYDLWPNQRDYIKAAQLNEQAMALGHWKAQFNLAGQYLRGLGVHKDVEKALQLTEDLMKKGVPAAWDNMGAYYMGGLGPLKQDATVAYAFWQRAADMGSMAAQTYIGAKLLGTHDEPPSFWGNRLIGLKMLECAFAQGYGQAAYELGVTIDGNDSSLNEDYARALKALHEGVKFGNEKSAKYLFAAFDDGDPLVGNSKDRARAERYRALGNALYSNPDLRFPNLDKVLPLPPARLPIWDGKKESLINAAKAVVPAPSAPPRPTDNPASKLTGRAYIPEGWMLPEHPAIKVEPLYESTRATESGYWVARLVNHSEERHVEWDAAQLPLYYAKNERFEQSRDGLFDSDGRIRFHYLGELIAAPEPGQSPLAHVNPLVKRGIARYGDWPEPAVICKGNTVCRKTGVWEARVADDHAHAPVFNQWHRQAYVQEGQPFPDPQALHLDIAQREVSWRWLAQANTGDPAAFTYIQIDAPQVFVAAEVVPTEIDVNAATEQIGNAASDSQGSSDGSAQQPDTKKPGLLGRIWPGRG